MTLGKVTTLINQLIIIVDVVVVGVYVLLAVGRARASFECVTSQVWKVQRSNSDIDGVDEENG